MVAETTLDRYHRYLDSIDGESQGVSDDDEYFELLSPGEAIDLLCTRDELAEAELDEQQSIELERLDQLLVKHYRLIAGNVPLQPDKSRSRWWWFLSEGPQVREQAEAA